MVALGDAALVAGLHAGAGLPLSVSFGIAVGANLALVLLLFVVLLLVRCLNRSSDRAMSQALTGPQVRVLCCNVFWGLNGSNSGVTHACSFASGAQDVLVAVFGSCLLLFCLGRM
jgi:hypothetical protein